MRIFHKRSKADWTNENNLSIYARKEESVSPELNSDLLSIIFSQTEHSNPRFIEIDPNS